MLEVGIEGQSQATAASQALPLLHRQAVDLPSPKLPGMAHKHTGGLLTWFEWRLKRKKKDGFNVKDQVSV